MSPLILIPFGVFFCCCLAQFPLLRAVRAALAERHPDAWREMSAKTWFANSAGAGYVWGDRAKALNDPGLVEAVNRLRLVYAVGFVAWLAIVALMLTSPVVAKH